MKLSRDFQRPLRYIVDQLMPPILRDSRIFKVALKIIFKNDSNTVWKFRQDFPTMTNEEVKEIYGKLSQHALKVSTDINSRCLRKINEEIAGKSVLDAGCGTGKLAELKKCSPVVFLGEFLGLEVLIFHCKEDSFVLKLFHVITIQRNLQIVI